MTLKLLEHFQKKYLIHCLKLIRNLLIIFLKYAKIIHINKFNFSFIPNPSFGIKLNINKIGKDINHLVIKDLYVRQGGISNAIIIFFIIFFLNDFLTIDKKIYAYE